MFTKPDNLFFSLGLCEGTCLCTRSSYEPRHMQKRFWLELCNLFEVCRVICAMQIENLWKPLKLFMKST